MTRTLAYNSNSPTNLLFHDLEDIFDHFFVDGRVSSLVAGDNFPKLNMYKENGKYIVEAGVAGWNVDDIEVKIDNSI